MPRGGYRRPTNAAPVSGPGALSRRTDTQPVRNPGGMPYGENADFADIQSSAPMAASPNVARAARAAVMPTQSPVALDAATQRPDEPLTTGSAYGPGAGPEILGLDATSQAASAASSQKLQAYMPMLLWLAQQPDTSPETRQVIRALRGSL